jgi:DNA-binding transcriptional MerR regulator
MGDELAEVRERLFRAVRGAIQLADRSGFWYGGQRYAGFHDRPELPLAVRQQIARWATSLGAASSQQRELAAMEPEPATRSELLSHLDAEDDLLSSPVFRRSMAALSADDQSRVLQPHMTLGKTFVWPLRAGEAARVIGTVSEKQLRDWDRLGLVRPVRWGAGKYRGYFRSQLLAALLVARALAAGWTVQRVREEIGMSAAPERAAVDALQELISAVPLRPNRSPRRSHRDYILNQSRVRWSAPLTQRRGGGGRVLSRPRIEAGHRRGSTRDAT